MKQTNNAIKFLMAQYRAIFNNAYFKGLATAALVTVAMAAGQAQANQTLTLGATEDAALKIELTSGSGTATASGSNKFASTISVSNGATLNLSGDVVATGKVTLNSGTLTINQSSSSGSLLLGSFNKENKLVYSADLEATNKSTLTLNSGNIGVANFDISDSTITLTSGGANGTNLTAYGVGTIQDGGRASGYKYNAVGNLTNVTATVNSGTNITAVGALTVTSGTIALNGDSGSGNFASVQGSKTALFDNTKITASGAGNFLFSRDLHLKDASVTVSGSGSVAVLGGVYDVNKFEDSQYSGDALAHQITITNGTFTTESGSKLNFGYDSGSKTELTLNGDVKFTNPEGGEVNFYNPKVVVEKTATLANLVSGSGSVVFNNTAAKKLVVNEAVDLNTLGIISGDGSLQKLTVSGTGALTLASDSVTLGTAFAADKLAVEAKTLTLGSGDFTHSSGSITVSDSFVGGGKYTISGGTLNLNATANGTVTKVSGFELASGATSALNVDGAWDFGKATLTADSGGTVTFTKANISNIGKIDVKKDGTVKLKDQSVLVGTDLAVASGGSLSLDNSTAQFSGAVTTKAASGDEIKLVNNSKIQFKYAEATKSGSSNEGLGTLTLDGTSTLTLVDSGKTEITLADLKKEKEKFFSGAGLFDLAGVKVTETGVAADGTITYDKAQSGAGIADIYENATVTGVSGSVSNSNDWGAAQLASGTTLELASGAALTLNGVNGNLVTQADGKTAADVKLASGSTLSVQSNGGTLDAITASAANQGKVLVGADLVVNKDIGASGSSVSELSVQKAGNTQVQNVYANVLNVDGKLEVAKNVAISGDSTVNGFLSAQDITSSSGTLAVQGQVEAKNISVSGDVSIGGSVVAESLKLTSTAQVKVGDADSSGLLEIGTLNLSGGSLLIDPSFDLDASVVAIKDVTDTTKDIVSVSGDIGVGMNSVLGIGLDAASAKDLVTRLGYLQNGKLQKDGVGAVLVVDNTLSIASGDNVIIDPTKDHAGLTTAIGSASGDSVTLAKGAGLVITDNMTTQSAAGTAVISFVNSGTASFTAESGSVIAFDKALTAADNVQLTNANTVNTTGATISAANGLLVGTSDNKGNITFALDTKAADRLYNQSTPIKDFTLSAIKGDFNANRAEAGVDYVLLTSGLNGGQAIEATSRLAVYGGSVQATNLAQQAATDAVVDRMSRANPNGSLVFANNAQGGGLWLSPVYKSHESDSFDSDGVDYGVDGDLTGLVLGADSTTESGVRVGGYFNFGSADFDGQGIGEQVSSEADYFGFGLYAGMTFGQMSLVADAGFTQVSNDVEQNTGYAKYSTVTADVDSTAVTLGLRGEYKLNVATMDVTPHLGVRYTRLAIDSYDAKSAGKVLATTDVDTMQMFSVPFGVTISKDIAAGSWTIKPVFDLTLTANAGDTDAKLDTTFIGATPVALTSEAFDSFTYGATMGIDAKYGENFSIGLNTNYVGSSNADEFGVIGNVRYMF